MLIRFNLWRVGAREQFSSLSKDCSMRTGYGKLSGQGYPAESVHVCIPTYKQAREKFSETYEDELGCRDKANGILLPFI
jgi:hypothetical protein